MGNTTDALGELSRLVNNMCAVRRAEMRVKYIMGTFASIAFALIVAFLCPPQYWDDGAHFDVVYYGCVVGIYFLMAMFRWPHDHCFFPLLPFFDMRGLFFQGIGVLAVAWLLRAHYREIINAENFEGIYLGIVAGLNALQFWIELFWSLKAMGRAERNNPL